MLESETFRRSLVLDDVNVNADALRHGYITNFAKEQRRELTAQECRLLYQTLLEDIAHMNMLDRDLYDYQDPCLDIMLEDDEKPSPPDSIPSVPAPWPSCRSGA